MSDDREPTILERHPWLVAILVGSTLLGAVGGVLLFQDWSVPRRAFAGAILGAGSALILTASRLIA